LSYPVGWRLRGPRHQALQDVSLEVLHGERLAVLGGNGSGKSTLLKLLADLLTHDRGEIRRNHGPCQLLNLSLGFMPNLSGRQNVVLSGLLQGFTRRYINSRLDDVKQFSELGDFFELPIRTYSSGMRSRLGFSLAMELSPDILLIDEALGVGDAAFREKSQRAMNEKIHSGLTVIIVSHSEAFVRETCTRALWLEGGMLRRQGSVDDVYSEYGEWRRSESMALRAAGKQGLRE